MVAKKPSRTQRLFAWFAETQNLKRFAFWNILFWLFNQVLINFWFFADRKSFNQYGIFYLSNISVAALWLAALSWWQSTRVESRQIEAEEAGG